MSDRGERLERGTEAIRAHVAVPWDSARVEQLLGRTKARRRRRLVARAAVVSVAALALGVFGGWASMPGADGGVREASATAVHRTRSGVIELPDGSRITPLTEDAEVVMRRVATDAIALDLVAGAARFEVVPNLPRTFTVDAGRIHVAVIGTVFEIARMGTDGDAEVRVIEGHVRVTWPPDGEANLRAGDSGRFPTPTTPDPATATATATPTDTVTATATDTVTATATATVTATATATDTAADTVTATDTDSASDSRRRRRVAPPTPPARPAWADLADRGEYDEAARLLEAEGPEWTSADLDLLMLAADTMRLTGRPQRALVLLDRATDVADGDAREHLVAFTRGRLLLGSLGRPRDAAADFARATSAPNRSLAEDAAAREVEALSRAGDTAAARERAEAFVQRYPNAIRLDAVRRWGGLTP